VLPGGGRCRAGRLRGGPAAARHRLADGAPGAPGSHRGRHRGERLPRVGGRAALRADPGHARRAGPAAVRGTGAGPGDPDHARRRPLAVRSHAVAVTGGQPRIGRALLSVSSNRPDTDRPGPTVAGGSPNLAL
jgi:hypothetical protein